MCWRWQSQVRIYYYPVHTFSQLLSSLERGVGKLGRNHHSSNFWVDVHSNAQLFWQWNSRELTNNAVDKPQVTW